MKLEVEEFKTFYFKVGFETLVPLATAIENQFQVEVGVGSDFLNIYTERLGLLRCVERAIRAWNVIHPHVELDPIEHGEVPDGSK